MQAAEMIGGVSGAGGSLVEAQERLVFAREHSLYVCQDLVAELGTVHVSPEPGQLIATPPPARHECLACHGRARMGSRAPGQSAAQTGLSEPAAPSCHCVLSDLGERSQSSAWWQCSRTGEPRAAHGSRLYGRANGAREDGRVLRER